MWATLLCLGSLILSISHEVEGFSKCQQAQLCVHNGLERCGQDIYTKKFRKFLDWCDLKEYNCLYSADFLHTTKDKCANLPPLDKKQTSKTPFNNPTINPTHNDPERPLFIPHGKIFSLNDPEIKELYKNNGKEYHRMLELDNHLANVNGRIKGNNQGVRKAFGKDNSLDKPTVTRKDRSYRKVSRRVWLR